MSHTGGLAEAQPSQPVSPLREDEPAIQGMFGGFRDSLPSAMDGRLILLPGGGDGHDGWARVGLWLDPHTLIQFRDLNTKTNWITPTYLKRNSLHSEKWSTQHKKYAYAHPHLTVGTPNKRLTNMGHSFVHF